MEFFLWRGAVPGAGARGGLLGEALGGNAVEYWTLALGEDWELGELRGERGSGVGRGDTGAVEERGDDEEGREARGEAREGGAGPRGDIETTAGMMSLM
jgi:hypothetical protein